MPLATHVSLRRSCNGVLRSEFSARKQREDKHRLVEGTNGYCTINSIDGLAYQASPKTYVKHLVFRRDSLILCFSHIIRLS